MERMTRHATRYTTRPSGGSTRARRALRVMVLVGLATGTAATRAAAQRADARALVAAAVELMGGEATLRGVERVRLDMMTQWQRTSFRNVPFTDRPSFEPHLDVRDYTIPAWRNTRRFRTRSVTNVIRDSIAITDFGNGFQPLSVAYVDERAELFTYTPDRLVLALLDAPDLAVAADTSIGEETFHAVTATLNGRFPSTVFFHAGTRLPAMLRFRAGHLNDFGLVPWGEMWVEVWYSNWRTFGAVSVPTQWDILRVGVPYKRMTIQSAEFNPEFAADSFTVSSAQREAYLASMAPRPMHESIQLSTLSWTAPSIAEIGTFGVANGAVRMADGWLLLGAGQAPFNYDQSVQALAELDDGPVAAVLVGNASTGNGGIVRASNAGIPIYVSRASEPFARKVLENAGRPESGLTRVGQGTVIGRGDGLVRLEPVDLPDTPGSVVLYHALTGWLFVPDGRTDLDVRLARARASELGWDVRAVGTPQRFYAEVDFQ